jgi:hypothetical protein
MVIMNQDISNLEKKETSKRQIENQGFNSG